MMINLRKLAAWRPTETPKLKMQKTAPGFAEIAMTLDSSLLALVKLRVAQLHGCKWYVHEQAEMMKTDGETNQRLLVLKDWKRVTIFSDREEAALNLAEVITRNPIDSVPDEDVHAACLFFNETEMIRLILVILAENDWHYLNGFSHGNMTSRPPHE